MGRILVFTPIHGFFDITREAFERIDKHVPAPFDHVITDDFSPPEAAEELAEQAGPLVREAKEIGERKVKRVAELGVKSGTNVGLQFQHAFRIAQGRGFGEGKNYEAILVVIYKALLWPGVVEAFREAQRLRGRKAGLIAGIITRPYFYNKLTVYSVGGVREDYGIGGQTCLPGVHIEQKLGAWRADWPRGTPRTGVLPWAHYTTLWIPRHIFTHSKIMPDQRFSMYYMDLDLSYQVKDAGFDVVATDKAISECGGPGLTTDARFGKKKAHSGPKHDAQVAGLAQLRAKWG